MSSNNGMNAPINFRAGHGVTVGMTRDQVAALVNTLERDVDLETVVINDGDPERARFIQLFVATVRAGLSPLVTNRPADVPAVDPGTAVSVALTPGQVEAIDRLIMARADGSHLTWSRQMPSGEIVLLSIMGEAPTGEEISAAIGETVHMIGRGKSSHGTATYRLERDQAWCRACTWINGHGAYCRNGVRPAAHYAELIMMMIGAHMASGDVPYTVADWSDLSEHVDENTYYERSGMPADPTPENDRLARDVADLVSARLRDRLS